MKNNLILISDNHHLYHKVKSSGFKCVDIDPTAIFTLDATDFDEVDMVIDLTCYDRDTKCDLLDRLGEIFEGKLITDLTINWGEYFLEKYENIDGACASAFFSPNNTYEIFTKDSDDLDEAITIFKSFGAQLESVSTPGITFTYPRVISMIINEAYFSKEEKLASDHDIDTAMKFGVNYPLGPFEWAQKIGHDKIVLVLDELYQITGDQRYRTSRLLRLQA